MTENLLFITQVVLPVFLLVVVGVFLKLFKIIDDQFIKLSSEFVYRVTLPVLIFMKLYDVKIDQTYDLKMVLLIVFGIIVTFLISLFTAKKLKLEPKNEGVFVQGAFRSNYAIVGLAIILRMYGPEAVAKASFLLLFALPLYNLLGIIALTIPFSKSKNLNIKDTVNEILKNPLLIAITIAILYSLIGLGLHTTIENTGNFIAETALPLALIGIGGSLNIKSIKEASLMAFGSSFIKNILSPFMVTVAAYYWGVMDVDLGIIFIVFACPTAIASFVLAAGLNGNIKLAGNIIIISTFGSIFTMIAGLFLLKLLNWI